MKTQTPISDPERPQSPFRAPEGYLENLEDRLMDRIDARQRESRRNRNVVWAVAASLAVLIASSIAIWSLGTSPEVSPPELALNLNEDVYWSLDPDLEELGGVALTEDMLLADFENDTTISHDVLVRYLEHTDISAYEVITEL